LIEIFREERIFFPPRVPTTQQHALVDRSLGRGRFDARQEWDRAGADRCTKRRVFNRKTVAWAIQTEQHD